MRRCCSSALRLRCFLRISNANGRSATGAVGRFFLGEISRIHFCFTAGSNAPLHTARTVIQVARKIPPPCRFQFNAGLCAAHVRLNVEVRFAAAVASPLKPRFKHAVFPFSKTVQARSQNTVFVPMTKSTRCRRKPPRSGSRSRTGLSSDLSSAKTLLSVVLHPERQSERQASP